jgi:C-terminal processing protease CtpA/Prc
MRNTSLTKIRVISLIGLLFVLSGITGAQPKAEVLNEWDRVDRLAGLARLWGTVKFFHPYIAYKEIDWDKALIETIPKVNAAKTAAEYEAAINHLLSFLNDRSTTAKIVKDNSTADSAAKKIDRTNLVRVENGVLILELTQMAEALAQDNSAGGEFRQRINNAIPQAKSVVLNCRTNDELGPYPSFYFDLFTRRVLVQLLDSNVTLGSSRARMHNGYAPQTGTTSGGYYSGFVTTTPQTIAGQNTKKSLPLVAIINDKTPDVGEIFSGLQASKHAVVVQEGEAKELAVSTFTIRLPLDVTVRMRTIELVNPDGSIGFQPDVVVPLGQQDSAMAAALQSLQNFNPGSRRTTQTATTQVGTQDKTYPEMEFPNSEYRLLALFRFWNVINYFFPYKHLIDEPWDLVLTRYIPKFEANKDAVDYQRTLFELATETHDSHVGVRNANKFWVKLGTFSAPLRLTFVEKQTVVTAVFDEKAGVKVGEVVTAIDGVPITQRREYFAGILPASTAQSLASRVDYSLLLGAKDSQAQLTLRGLDGTSRSVSVTRSLSMDDPRVYETAQRTGPVVQVLPSGFGYVDLERLQVAEVTQMFETIKNTPATIFDMRGYPHGTGWEIAPRLTEKKDVGAALFSRPILEAAKLSDGDLTDTRYTFMQRLPKAKGDVYKGKVVMLINEDAISQSEHTCMFFEVATDVTFIGTPTTGANGDVTTMVLPGNLVVSFSGHDVRHADGRQLQRLGIQPHVKSAPTVRGIVEKRDEVLETAVKYLQEKLIKVSTQ